MTDDAPACTLSLLGAGALLLDGAGPGAFSDIVQQRVWAVAAAVRRVAGVREAVPGVNTLMVVFDPLAIAPEAMEAALLGLWRDTPPVAAPGRYVEIAVVYGGMHGEDLAALAQHAGLPPDEVVRRHAGADYVVAAIGAMPGFPYLSGLHPSLAFGRRASPRAGVAEGSVIVGGAQAGIMPCTAPSGWHILGRTSVRLFDAGASPPALLAPGDRVRFVVEGIEP